MIAIRLLKSAAIAIAVIFGMVSAYYLLVQDRLIYYPRGYGAEDMKRLDDVGGKAIEFKTSQGKQFAYFLPARGGAKPARTWLCFCGNAGTALDWVGYLDVINPGDAYLLVDYPGYGKSEGRPSPRSFEENVSGGVKAFLADSGTTIEVMRPGLRVFGSSIGCAAALMAVDEFEIESGVLVSPFTSTMDVARKVAGWPFAWLLRHRFDNMARLRKIQDEKQSVDLVIFHGEKDAMGKRLATEFPKLATFKEVEGAGHNDILGIAGAAIAKAMQQD